MITNLISTTEFVALLSNIDPNDKKWHDLYKEKTGGYIEWTMWMWRLVADYVRFILQTPEEWMFKGENILFNDKLWDLNFIRNKTYKTLEELMSDNKKTKFELTETSLKEIGLL